MCRGCPVSLNPEVRRGGSLPFGMVASLWMCDPRYTTNARTLYGILVSYADTQGRDTARGRPYRPELAAQMGVSVSTVDRTLVEMEVAGMVVIEERTDPTNPTHNDANVYHLQDYPLMYAGNGEWKDPLGKGVKAADAAKELIERRRAEKRARGITRKGGVPKGVNPRAVKGQREAAEQDSAAERKGARGGSTHAATPSSTHAGTPAAPVLPNVYNPVQIPFRELPDAVGQGLGGFARAGAREGAAGENDGGDGGCAASDRDSIPHQQDADPAPDPRPARRSPRPATVRTAPRQMPPGYDLVRAAVPVEVARPGTQVYVGLRRAVADLLTGNPAAGIPARTPEQVITRINRRWHGEKGPERSARGYAPATTADADRPITSPQAWLAAAILGQDCTDPACEDGVLIGNGNPCTLCPERRADRSAARTGRALAEQHMTADLAWLARETAAYEEVAADHERGLRAQHAQYGLTGDHLDQAVTADLANWHDKHPKPTLTANRTTPAPAPAPRAARPAPAGDGRACIGWDAVPCGRRAVTTTGLCLACLAHADQQTATGAAQRA